MYFISQSLLTQKIVYVNAYQIQKLMIFVTISRSAKNISQETAG